MEFNQGNLTKNVVLTRGLYRYLIKLKFRCSPEKIGKAEPG
jgi:hypothetical protein